MKRVVIVTLVSAALLLTYGVSTGLAEDNTTAEQPIEIEVEGVNYCLLSDLAKEDVAGANSTYADLNALRVGAARDKDDNQLPDLDKKTLHYLPTREAEPLMVGKQYQGADVVVSCLYFPSAAAIKITKIVTIGGQEANFTGVKTGVKSNVNVLEEDGKSAPASGAASEDWGNVPTGKKSGQPER